MDRGSCEHPRPLLRRAWTSLDGEWDFATGDGDFDRTVVVPFAPETPASGVGARDPLTRVRYRRVVEPPAGTGRLLLHVGACQRRTTVRAGGEIVAVHEGGYTPISADITDAAGSGPFEVTVDATHEPRALDVPRGKQDWRDEPHSIWYPRTTGIWRTVWMERVPETHVATLHWRSDTEAMALELTARVAGPLPVQLRARVRDGERLLAEQSVNVATPEVELRLPIGDGGIDDRWRLAWSPRRPRLLDVDIDLVDEDGAVVDRVESYAALRSIEVRDGRLLLNGRPQHLRLVLDQGYWADTGLTAPDVAALGRDIELTKALGFNGARKHQKVEDPRYLALADVLGLLVWVEMPSAYRPGATTSRNVLREWLDVVELTRSHPSVIAWVPVNESWGMPSVATDDRQRALLDALVAATNALDGTRPVSANDGWETAGGDIVGIHDYDQDAEALRARYRDGAAIDAMTQRGRPDGRLVDLDRASPGGRAVVLSEFGGVALHDDEEGTWGYTRASSPDDLLRRYAEQWRAIHDSDVLAGACWTQLTDTYQEANGLLRMDRTPKAPLELLSAATRGALVDG